MKIKFNDFRKGINRKNSDNLVALSEAKNCYNFDFSGGMLKGCFPFEACFGAILAESGLSEEFTDSEKVLEGGAIFYYKKFDFDQQKDASKLILVTPKLNTFYLNLTDNTQNFVSLGVQFTSLPSAINYRLDSEDVIIFSSPTDNMVLWNGVGEAEIVIDAPKITSMCLHSERLFATTDDGSNTVWFSDDLDPTNWSISLVDAGFIQLADERGKPIKVVSFNGYVYIFRDKGISRLTASGAQEEFYLSHLFVSSGKIYEKTICLCGDKIIFLASDGIYSFNGSETTKILGDLSDLVKPAENSTAVFFDGKYYLSAHIDFEDSAFEDSERDVNALFILDAESREYSIQRGISVSSMVVADEEREHKLYFLNDFMAESEENRFAVLNKKQLISPLSKYKTGLYDFGEPSKKKTVRKVIVCKAGEGELEVKVFSEQGKAELVKIVEDFSSQPILFSGKAIGFEVTAKGEIELQNLTFEIY